MLRELIETKTNPFSISISTVAQDGIEVRKSIPVMIRPVQGGSFIASFVDAGISFSGDTILTAVHNLQKAIADSFEMLVDMHDDQLGPKMRRERKVLMEFLCRC